MIEPQQRWPQPPPEQPRPRSIPLPTYRPWLVWVILAANVLVYIAARQLRQPGDDFIDVLYRFGAMWGPAIDEGEYWRLLAPMVLHGSLAHLAVNSFSLYAMGPDTERIFGTLRFVVIYLVAGVGGTVLSYAFSDNRLSVGASGAIFGLLGALGAFFWRARATLGETSQAQLRQIAWIAALNFAIGLSIENIDNYGHLGGLIGGTLAGLALAPRFDLVVTPEQPELRRRESGISGWLLVGALAGLLVGATIAIKVLR